MGFPGVISWNPIWNYSAVAELSSSTLLLKTSNAVALKKTYLAILLGTFWDGEFTWPFQRVVGDLQLPIGIKRSQLESPATFPYFPGIPVIHLNGFLVPILNPWRRLRCRLHFRPLPFQTTAAAGAVAAGAFKPGKLRVFDETEQFWELRSTWVFP